MHVIASVLNKENRLNEMKKIKKIFCDCNVKIYTASESEVPGISLFVIVISKLLKCHSKAKHRAPAYSRALIRGC